MLESLNINMIAPVRVFRFLMKASQVKGEILANLVIPFLYHHYNIYADLIQVHITPPTYKS